MIVFSQSRSRFWHEDPSRLRGPGPRYVLAPDLNQSLVLPHAFAVAAFLKAVGASARARPPGAVALVWGGGWSLSDASRQALGEALRLGCKWAQVPDDFHRGERLWVCLTDAYLRARLVTRTDLEKAVKAAVNSAPLSLIEKHLPFTLETC